jgi:DNA invertase Pin-like site-specific DNA recombinase
MIRGRKPDAPGSGLPIVSLFKRSFERVTVSGFVAYYRVSTDKQGRFGLGMEAQREAVTRFLATRGQLAGEFVEVESGRNHTNRPQLTAALAECRKRRAVLVIAKLDRLARNVHFISGLMNSDVEFVAVDMPTANRLTIRSQRF